MSGECVLSTGLSLGLVDDLVVWAANGDVDVEESTFDDLKNNTYEMIGVMYKVNKDKTKLS